MSATKPVEIDLRRDLPKVRAQWERLILRRGKCLYAAPCIIGAMVPKSRRAGLDKEVTLGAGSPNVYSLIESGRVAVPAEQRADIISLQEKFDNEDGGCIEAIVARLEAKYLPARPIKTEAPA